MAKYKISTTCEIEVEAENHQNALKTAKNTSFDYWTQNPKTYEVRQIEDLDENGISCHICEKSVEWENGMADGCDAELFFDKNEVLGNDGEWVISAGYGSKHDMEDLRVVGEIGGEHYLGKSICDDCIDSGIANGSILLVPQPDYGDFFSAEPLDEDIPF